MINALICGRVARLKKVKSPQFDQLIVGSGIIRIGSAEHVPDDHKVMPPIECAVRVERAPGASLYETGN
jgi:phosphotransferase system IIA component